MIMMMILVILVRLMVILDIGYTDDTDDDTGCTDETDGDTVYRLY